MLLSGAKEVRYNVSVESVTNWYDWFVWGHWGVLPTKLNRLHTIAFRHSNFDVNVGHSLLIVLEYFSTSFLSLC